MGIFKKGTKQMEKLSAFTPAAIESKIVMLTNWRAIVDDELDGAISELVKHGISRKEASKPSWTRRLGVLKDGSAFVVTIELYCNDISGKYFPDQHGVPAFATVALPLQYAVELLASPFSPEIELAARRKRFDEYQKAQDAKRAAEAKKLADANALRDAENKLQSDCRAGDWALLNSLERFAIRLSLAVEKHNPELATDLRGIVAHSLAGNDADAGSWPRNASWFAGLGLEQLSAERRQELSLASQGEREIRQLESIPPGKKPALAAMAGNDRAAMLAHWAQIKAANRRFTPKAAADEDDGGGNSFQHYMNQ
jgi:hypothetical protein